MVNLLKLAAILAAIVLLLRLRWNLGLVLLLAAAATGLLFGLSPGQLVLNALEATVDRLTLELVAIVLLITFLGQILRGTLQLEGLVRSLGDLFVDRRWLLPLLPSLIGFLPMVGGAMFSAPMIEEAGQGLALSAERKTMINYWFRHAWEPVVPIYPSLVLAAGLMGVPVQTLTLTQWPLFLTALLGGTLFGLLGIAGERRNGDPQGNEPEIAQVPLRQPTLGGGIQSPLATESRGRPALKDTLLLLARSIWPIALVLGLSIVLDLNLIVSLLITIALLIAAQHLGPKRLLDMARTMPWDTAPVIVGTLIFRRVLETSSAIESTSQAFTALGIPLPVLLFVVPMIAGLLTGLAAAAFAIGFPIVFPLVGADLITSGYGLLAFAGGYVGILLSPVHLCLTLTRIYFQAEWGGIFRRMVPAAILLVLSAAAVLLVRMA